MASTTKKNEKVRLVGDYLKSLAVEDAARAAVFFTGLAFPRNQEKILAVGASLLWQAVARLANLGPGAMEAVYRAHGDLGGMTAEIFANQQGGGLALGDVAGAFEELATRRGPSQKLPALEALLRRAGALEAKYIVKIITGDLRIGLKESLVEEAIAGAFGRPAAEVRRANMLTGDIGETLRLAAAGRLAEARLQLFHPLGFMLASPAETPAEAMEYFPSGALMEDKYDGIRAQAHKGPGPPAGGAAGAGGRVKLFSRTLDEIVEFPELAAPLAALPGEFILDGEILAWRDGRALPFTELQQRLGRKQPDLFLSSQVPVSFLAFDLLYWNGEILLDSPLAERRRCLASLLEGGGGAGLQLSPMASCASVEQLQRAFDVAFERGNEGVMVKGPDSPYTSGRRGRWWLKLKRPLATLDVVVTAVEYGHGKRRGLLSDFTFSVRADGADRLVTVGKAYSGLTDAEILALTEFFKQHTVEDQGFRLAVEPLVVMEVAFNNIQRSARHQGGYALRFPRIVRLRPDKPVSEIDTLERVKQLYERQLRVSKA